MGDVVEGEVLSPVTGGTRRSSPPMLANTRFPPRESRWRALINPLFHYCTAGQFTIHVSLRLCCVPLIWRSRDWRNKALHSIQMFIFPSGHGTSKHPIHSARPHLSKCVFNPFTELQIKRSSSVQLIKKMFKWTKFVACFSPKKTKNKEAKKRYGLSLVTFYKVVG